MGTAVKTLGAQSKHLTSEERAARADAEAGVVPTREADLRRPRGLTGAAGKYWDSIVRRLEGLSLLDDLDREMLTGYCSMLARRDHLDKLLAKLLASAVKEDCSTMTAEETNKLDSLSGKLATLDRNLMVYADKLGFTPQGRVRLAQKRAAAAIEAYPDADLYGDG